MSSGQIASVRVRRREFEQALRGLAKISRFNQSSEAVIGFADGDLEVTVGGATVRVSAQGTWPGEAVMDAALLMGVGRLLPTGDPLTLAVEETTFSIQRWRAPCRWQVPEIAAIEVPMNASRLDYLRLGLVHTLDQLDRSGIRPEYDKAVEHRDGDITAAHNYLREYGVTHEEVRKLVESALMRNI